MRAGRRRRSITMTIWGRVGIAGPRQRGDDAGGLDHGELQRAQPADGDVVPDLRLKFSLVWLRSAGALRETLDGDGDWERAGLEPDNVLLLRWMEPGPGAVGHDGRGPNAFSAIRAGIGRLGADRALSPAA